MRQSSERASIDFKESFKAIKSLKTDDSVRRFQRTVVTSAVGDKAQSWRTARSWEWQEESVAKSAKKCATSVAHYKRAVWTLCLLSCHYSEDPLCCVPNFVCRMSSCFLWKSASLCSKTSLYDYKPRRHAEEYSESFWMFTFPGRKVIVPRTQIFKECVWLSLKRPASLEVFTLWKELAMTELKPSRFFSFRCLSLYRVERKQRWNRVFSGAHRYTAHFRLSTLLTEAKRRSFLINSNRRSALVLLKGLEMLMLAADRMYRYGKTEQRNST